MSNQNILTKNRNQELATLAGMLTEFYSATLQIAQPDDERALLQRIVDVARELLHANYGVLALRPQETIDITLIFSGFSAGDAEKIKQQPQDRGLFSAAITDRAILRVGDVRENARFAGSLPQHPQIKSFLAAPIIVDGKIYGRLTIARQPEHPAFTVIEEQFLAILVAQAAIAIKNKELLQFNYRQQKHLERQYRQLAALHTATMAIAGELALENVLQQIIDSARELVDALYGALGVPNHEGHLDTFITSGMPTADIESIPHLPDGKGLLGAIYSERRTIRIPRINDDPRSVGFPANHPPMEPFLGVPIIAGKEVLGNLYFTNKLNGGDFTEDDQQVVEMLAGHAAIAIQNARLYEQVGRLAIVEERNRIGMDLHDGVIQSIFAVGLTLESTKLSLHEHPDEADILLEQAIIGLNDTIRDIRNYILDLRPHRFRGDLEAGLGRLMREFQANTMVPVEITGDLAFTVDLTSDVARAIFLTTQEALANIARHAKASRVQIDIMLKDNNFIMTIEDDGQGFDMRARTYSIGHGLSNMRTRAEDLNGVYKIYSHVGKGTRIILNLPLS